MKPIVVIITTRIFDLKVAIVVGEGKKEGGTTTTTGVYRSMAEKIYDWRAITMPTKKDILLDAEDTKDIII